MVDNEITGGCPKCGMTKSGILSCCGRGGTWFGKCGNKVTKFLLYTWIEGIGACMSECERIRMSVHMLHKY